MNGTANSSLFDDQRAFTRAAPNLSPEVLNTFSHRCGDSTAVGLVRRGASRICLIQSAPQSRLEATRDTRVTLGEGDNGYFESRLTRSCTA
jgi:hypothetical protein